MLEPNPTKKKRFNPETIEELKRKESGSSEDIIEMHIKNSKDSMLTVACGTGKDNRIIFR